MELWLMELVVRRFFGDWGAFGRLGVFSVQFSGCLGCWNLGLLGLVIRKLLGDWVAFLFHRAGLNTEL